MTGINAVKIIELLINAGAHIDCVNNYDETPLDVAMITETRSLLQSMYRPSRLKCLCARLITTEQLNYDSMWPAETALNRFIVLHGDLSRKHILFDQSSSIDDDLDDVEYD